MRSLLVLLLLAAACKSSSEQQLKVTTETHQAETDNSTHAADTSTATAKTEKTATQETKTADPVTVSRTRVVRIDATPTAPGRTITTRTRIERGKVVDQKGSQDAKAENVQTAARVQDATQAVKAADAKVVKEEDKSKKSAPSLGFSLGLWGSLGLIVALLAGAGGLAWRLKPPWMNWLWSALGLLRGSAPAPPA